jgi:serine/threonine protein kinase
MKIDIFTLKEKLGICIDISVALYYLHSRNPKVLHRDLKSANCLVDKHNRVKLCDFGLSKIYENSNLQTNSISTFFWMAPEYLQNGTFSDKSDIYSLGILFWEIFMKDTLPYKNIRENCFLIGEANAWEKRPEFGSKFDSDIKALIEACWNKDPEKRPGIRNVVESLKKLQSVKFTH